VDSIPKNRLMQDKLKEKTGPCYQGPALQKYSENIKPRKSVFRDVSLSLQDYFPGHHPIFCFQLQVINTIDEPGMSP